MIGYACLALGVPGSKMKSTILKNATEERLFSLIGHNLGALECLIDYNIRQGILLFRISSDLIPFGSSVAMDLDWPEHFAADLERIGEKIISSGLRASMHPGQYTVINSPDSGVAERAVLDLEYHNLLFDSLRLGPEHKIILHLGGVYGDKDTAKERFVMRWQDLSPAIRSRLVIENDDRLFTIQDVLDVSAQTGIPVVYDNLHNAINPSDASRSDLDWISQAAASWQPADGRQKIHYSQQAEDKRPGAHSATIAVMPFLDFYEQLPDIDIMLEVKDKNLSTLKCINCTTRRGIAALEAEWARYKYSVLEHDPAAYQAVRELLKDKRSYPAIEMYQLIEAALAEEVQLGSAVNAAQHVWSYFRKQASPAEKKRWDTTLEKYIDGAASLTTVKSVLQKLADQYDEDYLRRSYYFEL